MSTNKSLDFFLHLIVKNVDEILFIEIKYQKPNGM